MEEQVSLEIQKDIRQRAKSYTPEWRFDTKTPDIGSALALAFTQMMAGTVKRFSQIPQKNRLAFLNQLDAGLLPAVPSQGYVQFSLINEEVEGVEVVRGTTVFAEDAAQADGQVAFETQDDVFVVPAAVSDVYQSCDYYDTLFQCFDRTKEEWKPFSLFLSEGVNLQEHAMYFVQDTILAVQSDVCLELEWFSQDSVLLADKFLRLLAEASEAEFTYYSVDGWQPFVSLKQEQGKLLLYKDKSQPGFARKEIEGQEGYWIRCRLLNFSPFQKVPLTCIKLSSWNHEMLPDTIYGAQEECDLHQFFPFGERLDLYQEVYFGSEEVLSKKGAQITFSFGIDFVKIPLENSETEDVQWEWIMKRGDFKIDKEFDVTIESVIWEYFNGSGWTRLYLKEENNHIFSVTDSTKGAYRQFVFECPRDMEKTLVNAVETYYIRARIMKINNLYKLKGNYIVPRLNNTSFCYHYRENKLEAQAYVFQNNGESRLWTWEEQSDGQVFPFVQTGLDNKAVYLGFEVSPVGSPLKMLFCIGNDKKRKDKHLLWEYWNGKKWKSMHLIDETDNFSHTGIITTSCNPDMEEKILFGRNRYWFRIQDMGKQYMDKENDIECPVLQKICMNTTGIKNVEKRQREYFQMEISQENKSFTLSDRNICEAEVYLRNQGYHSDEELEMLGREQRLKLEMDEDETMAQTWVKWIRVEDFTESGPTDCHYVIDSSAGTLQFGNGKHGRIPNVSRTENICVDYCCGGGEHTNLAKGAVSRMESYTGYINEVTNPCKITGGCDTETLKEAEKRTSAAIRHQNRAVSARDYEELALSMARDLLMAKCFAGYDDTGKRVGGAVTLVVLPKQFRQGNFSFLAIRDRIVSNMAEKIGTSLLFQHKFFVVLPELIEIRLRIALTVENFHQVFSVKKEILERLDKFLNPAMEKGVRGNWDIGSFPNTMQIKNSISDVKGIVYIRNIMMSAYTADRAKQKEVDVEVVKTHRYVLPVNGKHEIMIDVA